MGPTEPHGAEAMSYPSIILNTDMMMLPTWKMLNTSNFSECVANICYSVFISKAMKIAEVTAI